MKIRQGFVSNSSSASFIVHWRVKDFGEKFTIKRAFSKLYQVFEYDEEKDEIDWEKAKYDVHLKPKLEYIEKFTKINADGSFVTNFFTSMLNEPDDFGDVAKSFIMALMVYSDNFQIIDTKVEDEGCW